MTAAAPTTLTRITGAVAAVANPDDDMRTRQVRDADGLRAGRVRAVYVDDTARPRFLLVGGCRGRALLPVDEIRSTTVSTVHLRVTRDKLAAAPGYDPHRIDDRDYQQGLYDYYRQTPYWAAGYTYPDFNR